MDPSNDLKWATDKSDPRCEGALRYLIEAFDPGGLTRVPREMLNTWFRETPATRPIAAIEMPSLIAARIASSRASRARR